MKNILIAGSNSYIGDSVADYLGQYPDAYSLTILDTIGIKPKQEQFAQYDVVYCVSGIVHIKETRQNRQLYYDINRDLVVEMAKKAKQAGVRQFILMSTMSVYGMMEGQITKQTAPHPFNAYGESKVQADEAIRALEDETFKFACLRPPMVYGKGCKGNYPRLRKLALSNPIFPDWHNQRSMCYIGNLCEFVKQCIDEEKSGLFFPQNAEYTDTSKMVQLIAECHGKQIRMTKAFNRVIPVIRINAAKKMFGNLTYEPVDLVNRFSLKDSIRQIECSGEKTDE